METILVMARALSRASFRQITRLDIQYNIIKDLYYGYVDLKDEDNSIRFAICEDGTVEKIERS